MLEQQAVKAGLARFAVELRDRQRAFASEVNRIYVSAVDRGMLHSGGTVGQISDAIRAEYKARAALLWRILQELIDPATLGDGPRDSDQLKSLVAEAVDGASGDLSAQYDEVSRLMGTALRMPPLKDFRDEAIGQVNADIDVEMIKMSRAALPSTAAPRARPATRERTIFLGSSSAAKSQAKAVVAALERPGLVFLPWWDAFTPGSTLLEELDVICDKVDGALLLFSPESETTIRGKDVSVPNLNVLFEFGYFYGHFGKHRVGMLKYGEFYLPSDFGGYIHVTGSKFFKRGKVVKVGKRTANEFDRWVQGL